jgi:hypothetical protein
MMTQGDLEQARYAGNDPRRPSYQEAQERFPTPAAFYDSMCEDKSSDDRTSPGLATCVVRREKGDPHPHDRNAPEESFPTPTVYDASGKGNPRAEQKEGSRHAVSLHHLAAEWPTPRVGGGNRTSRQSLTNEKGHPKGRSNVGLEQAVEMADGRLPSELEGLTPEDVLPGVRRRWPTPRTAMASMYPESDEANANRGGESLATAVDKEEQDPRMWPTPSACLAGEGEEYLEGLVNKAGEPVQPGERAYHPDAKWHVQVTLNRAVRLFPTPRAQDAKHGEATDNELAREKGMDLLHVRLKREGPWPTPMASSNRTSQKAQTGRPTAGPSRGGSSLGLEDAVEAEEGRREWPTPRHRDHKGPGFGDDLPAHVEEDERRKEWPTPRASNPGSRPNGNGGKVLAEEVEIAAGTRERGKKKEDWPTPRANDWKGADPARDENRSGKRHAGDDLATAVDKKTNWPTPTSGMYKQDVMDTGQYAEGIQDRGHQVMLSASVKLEDDTPPEKREPGLLNPDWVDWLMGWPIGWTCLDPLPAQSLELWAAASHEGIWWSIEPPHIPRTTRNKVQRTNRLKADGNGQVSLCAAAAASVLYRVIQDIDTKEGQADVEYDLMDFCE